MWLGNAIFSGFTLEAPLTGLCLFRAVIGLIFLYKFSLETTRGYFRYFDPGALLYEMDKLSGNLPLMRTVHYKLLYVAKVVATFCLIVGALPQIALAILIVAFLLECRLYFKFHTSLFALACFSLLWSPDLSAGFSVSNWGVPPAGATGSQLSAAMIVSMVLVLYLTTFTRKVLSGQFNSGLVLLRTIQFLHEQAPFRRYRDSYYPRIFVGTLVVGSDERVLTRWRPIIWGTIVAHFAIPLLLISDTWTFLGAIVGIILHIGYTLFYQLTLIHFSMLMVSTYIFFFDPVTVDAFVRAMLAGRS